VEKENGKSTFVDLSIMETFKFQEIKQRTCSAEEKAAIKSAAGQSPLSAFRKASQAEVDDATFKRIRIVGHDGQWTAKY
jgi:hypothetical protein